MRGRLGGLRGEGDNGENNRAGAVRVGIILGFKEWGHGHGHGLRVSNGTLLDCSLYKGGGLAAGVRRVRGAAPDWCPRARWTRGRGRSRPASDAWMVVDGAKHHQRALLPATCHCGPLPPQSPHPHLELSCFSYPFYTHPSAAGVSVYGAAPPTAMWSRTRFDTPRLCFHGQGSGRQGSRAVRYDRYP